MSELESKPRGQKFSSRIARAVLITAASAVLWLIVWFLTSMFLAGFPEYPKLFSTIAWGLLFFTFTIALAEGTIYKYILIIARAFFLMIYLTYATNWGVLTANFGNLMFTVEFTSLIALIIAINLLEVARGLLLAIEFAAQSPKD
ncbi:MAG: hypothetical protein QXY74_01605 [Candidatus Bathyarchaeia archaeon]